MFHNWKKMCALSATSLVAMTSFLTAEDDMRVRQLENRVNNLETKRSSSGILNPNGRPNIKNGADIFISADALWWKAQENGLDFVVSGTTKSGTFRKPHFDYDWGFRVGLGYNTPKDGWDLFLNWTRFHPDRTHNSQSRGKKGQLVPLYLSPIAQTEILNPTKVVGTWKMHLDVIDLELGREFLTSKWLALRPFIGLRNAWIHQRLDTHEYNAVLDGNQLADLREHMKNNFWGIGLRSGLNTDWRLGAGFSIFGDAAISLLSGHYEVEFEENSKVTGFPESGTIPSRNERSFHVAAAIADLALGLRYDHLFADNCFYLRIQLGWEEHIFFGQNQFVRFIGPNSFASNQGDLTTQGLAFNVRFGF